MTRDHVIARIGALTASLSAALTGGAVVVLLTGCGGKDVEDTDVYTDLDGDGYAGGEDCDDADPAVHPGANELCNDVDDDCDTLVDEDAVDATTWYADADGDTFGDAAVSTVACDPPAGHVADGTDCDDTTAAVHPGATEVCNGGVDDDCDTLADDADDSLDVSTALTWYADADTDTYGDATASTTACLQPAGYVADGTDCDDADPILFPEADGSCADGADCGFIAGTLRDVGTGLYLIDPDGSRAGDAPYDAYCDMVGGWTLVARCIDDNIAYDDPAWTVADTLIDGANYSFSTVGCSRYATFDDVPLVELRTSYPDGSDELIEDFGGAMAFDSALDLFSAGWEISTDFQPYFDDMMDPFMQEWGCTSFRTYGISQADYIDTTHWVGSSSYCDWNGWARWGQRVNADQGGTGNHTGQGWGAYSLIGHEEHYGITQLMWVR